MEAQSVWELTQCCAATQCILVSVSLFSPLPPCSHPLEFSLLLLSCVLCKTILEMLSKAPNHCPLTGDPTCGFLSPACHSCPPSGLLEKCKELFLQVPTPCHGHRDVSKACQAPETHDEVGSGPKAPLVPLLSISSTPHSC